MMQDNFGLIIQASKKEHKPKPIESTDIFWWGRGLPREGVGAKEFDMSLEAKQIKLFWWDITRDFVGISGKCPKSYHEKKNTYRDKKKAWDMAMFRANVPANNSGQFGGAANENVGLSRQKGGQKVHPNFAPNMTMRFHYHAFCAPESLRFNFWPLTGN